MRVIIAAAALLLITACGTTGPAGAEGPTGPIGPTGPGGTIDRATIYCKHAYDAPPHYPSGVSSPPYDLFWTTVSCDSPAHKPLTGSCANLDPLPPGFWLYRSDALNWSDTTVAASWVCEWKIVGGSYLVSITNTVAEICCVP